MAIIPKRLYAIPTLSSFICYVYMETVLITGGTGLIGKALTKQLVCRGYTVIILTRNKKIAENNQHILYAEWNVASGTIDGDAVARADYIIHLAGANVAEKRWTEKRKKEIVDSRVQSGRLLVKALTEIPNHIQAVVSASAIGWYGPDPQIPNSTPFVETDPSATDFLGTTSKKWEAAIEPVTELGKRLVVLRTGIVLSNEGGAYAEFKKSLNFGIAPVLGNGKQMISWIHLNDLVRIYIEAIENKKWQGTYNAVAPNPVSNRSLITEMAKQRGKLYVRGPVPAVVLKTVLGEMSVEVLKSATVSSERLKATGFQCMFQHIGTAVYNLQKKVP